MPLSSSAQQKQAVAEFISVTQADKSNAQKFLKQHNWNTSAAVNAYFSNPSNSLANPLRASLTKVFDKYRDDPANEPDEINVEGVGKLLGDMDIGLDDIGALVFSELVQSPSLGKITREDFITGCIDAGSSIDSVPRLRNTVLQRRSQLAATPALFKNVYNHTFTLALQPGQKSLPLDLAAEFWRMLFTSPGLEWSNARTPWLDWWLEFLEDKWKRAVNKDLWKQTLTFAEATRRDETLGFWSEDSSWPSVIDEFVAWVRTTKRAGEANGEAMELA